jgi:hypothetical protein
VDVFETRNAVIDDYKAFTQGFLRIRDEEIRGHVERGLAFGLLWPQPWLALDPSFEPAGTVDDLVAAGVR